MADEGAVGLVHRHPQLFAVDVVALGEVEGDDAVGVPGDDLLGGTGEQIEGQADLRVLVLAEDRQLEFVEFDDDAPLGEFGLGERGHGVGVGVVGTGAGQPARLAQRGQPLTDLDEPVARCNAAVGAATDQRIVDLGLLVVVEDLDGSGGRWKPSLLSQFRHSEFSKISCWPHLRQWKSRNVALLG